MTQRKQTRPTLEYYCSGCKIMRDFRHVSSNAATAGQPEQHFYTCDKNCGTTYTQRQILSIENARRLHEWSVTTDE